MITSANVMYMPAHNFSTNFFILTKRIVCHSKISDWKLSLFYTILMCNPRRNRYASDDGTATILCLCSPTIQKERTSSKPVDREIFFDITSKAVLSKESSRRSGGCIHDYHDLIRTPSPERIVVSPCF
jgi:hypothetical protein